MPRDTRDVADVTSDPATAATGKTAVLYRIALPNHLCPAGQKARWLLERKGYEVDDRLFRARSEVDAFIVSPNNNHPNEGGGLAQGSDKGKGQRARLSSPKQRLCRQQNWPPPPPARQWSLL